MPKNTGLEIVNHSSPPPRLERSEQGPYAGNKSGRVSNGRRPQAPLKVGNSTPYGSPAEFSIRGRTTQTTVTREKLRGAE